MTDFGLDVTSFFGLDSSECIFEGLYRYLHGALTSGRKVSLLTGATVEFADDGGDVKAFLPYLAACISMFASYLHSCQGTTQVTEQQMPLVRSPIVFTAHSMSTRTWIFSLDFEFQQSSPVWVGFLFPPNIFHFFSKDFTPQMLLGYVNLGASNVGNGYSNLLKDAVVFGVFDHPIRHLDDVRDYNGCSPPSFQEKPHGCRPLAAISFPGYPECKDSEINKTTQPHVSCFAHFKLLSSFNPNRQEVCLDVLSVVASITIRHWTLLLKLEICHYLCHAG